MPTISPAEAARMLGVSADTIRKYVRAGLLPGKLFPGGRVRLEAAAVERFYESLPDAKSVDINEIADIEDSQGRRR